MGVCIHVLSCDWGRPCWWFLLMNSWETTLKKYCVDWTNRMGLKKLLSGLSTYYWCIWCVLGLLKSKMQRWVARHFQPTCVPNLAHSAISIINSYYRNHDPWWKIFRMAQKLSWFGVSQKIRGGWKHFYHCFFFSFQKFAVRILAEMTPFQPSVVRVYRLAACTQHFFYL